jgi:protein-S-isoprenylcysteine O-methyltransferase Ste14
MISFTAMFSLNLSFGVVPANRGVKSGGLYKIVRHPIYSGYLLSFTCFVIQNISDFESLIRNVSILVISLVALIFRIKYEEAFLSKDAEYRKLMETTPYRLIPKVW